MKRRNLTYQFHNPNTAEVTADIFYDIESIDPKKDISMREIYGMDPESAQ